MVDTTITAVTLDDEASVSSVSWGAIFAGVAVSLAVTFLVLALGTGLGLSVVSPWESSVSATTFKIGTGLFLIVVAMLSSSLGGYIAARLRTRSVGVHTDEVFFRDTAHGFVTWAAATVIGFAILAVPASGIIGSATSGALQGAGNAASGPAETYADQLLRPATNNTAQAAPAGDNANAQAMPSNNAGGNSGAGNSNADTRAEFGRLLSSGLQNGGEISADDRAYMSRVIASRTGMSQAEADKRVADVITKAKNAAEAARKAALQVAFWLTASLLIGAFCASLAAAEGGAIRDGYRTWRRI